MGKNRLNTIMALLRGLLTAIAVTLLGMVAIAAAAVYAQASDGWIRGLNQLLKCASIGTGTLAAVGIGGEKGFFTGMAVAILYMSLGYGLAVGLGGNSFAVPGMLGEILIGAALGGVCGAVLSNLPARRRRAA